MFLESSYRVLSGHENNAIGTEMSKTTMCWTPIFCHFYDVICSPGYVDLLTQRAILWSHWKTSGNVYVGLATATSTFEQRNSASNGLDRASDWCFKLSYATKKFFGSLNFFCEKFPIKQCSTHNMWIRWSFRSISSSYFHRNIMYIWIFAHPRLTSYQLDWTRMCISENSSRTFAGVALHSKKLTN